MQFLQELKPITISDNGKKEKKTASILDIDRRKGMTLFFSENQNSIQFASESIQELFFMKIDIADIVHFSYADIYGENIEQADNLLSEFKSFYDLLMIEEDELRFPITFSKFKNEIMLNFEFNLTTIRSEDKNSLLNFVSFIFEEFKYSVNECHRIILENPDRIIRIFKRNSKLQYTFKTQS